MTGELLKPFLRNVRPTQDEVLAAAESGRWGEAWAAHLKRTAGLALYEVIADGFHLKVPDGSTDEDWFIAVSALALAIENAPGERRLPVSTRARLALRLVAACTELFLMVQKSTLESFDHGYFGLLNGQVGALNTLLWAEAADYFADALKHRDRREKDARGNRASLKVRLQWEREAKQKARSYRQSNPEISNRGIARLLHKAAIAGLPSQERLEKATIPKWTGLGLEDVPPRKKG